MTEKTAIGNRGETAAVTYLQKKGYSIVARNWHSRYGEIDIIATKDEFLAFVEVKTRKKGAMVTPTEAVNYAKQKKIRLTAQKYLLDNPTDLQPRFDVCSVIYYNDRCTIEYFAAAFC